MLPRTGTYSILHPMDKVDQGGRIFHFETTLQKHENHIPVHIIHHLIFLMMHQGNAIKLLFETT